MKTILLVVGLTALLFGGVWSIPPPCNDKDCGDFGHCNDNTSMCECYPGFTGTPCEDIDECSYEPCGKGAICINFNGSYGCLCDYGYTGNESYCEDINECELAPGLCGPPQINQCINLDGSYTCDCNEEYGFFYNPTNRTCTTDVILELPVELDATIISDRDGCYPGDIDEYIQDVKEESLEILREVLQQLGFHDDTSQN